ncbi:AAA family ATPase [Paucidesulfovibrio longus]|uniref:AAA family ATPase n=1 Tax=Paucidesulfovibrio longus TaxID=889 RepID=UPI0003B576E7|nr:histidine kinase [Paucidesulfovibrio longus]
MHDEIRIALAVRDETARQGLEKTIRAAKGVSLQARGEPSDILVYEVDPRTEQDFPRLSRALASQTRGEVFLTCAEPSPEFLIQAMRAGIHEFLPLPVPPKELGRALARFAERRRGPESGSAPASGKVTLVAGAKAGTGATTLAVNLACALQARGERTALLDLRRPLGETPLFLDLEYAYTWGEAAENLDRLDATYLESLLARHSSGLAVLASPGDALPGADLGETVFRIISELRRNFDQIVVDGEAGLEGYGLRDVDASDQVLLVMNPSLPCLAHAKRVLEGLRRSGGQEDKIRIVASRQLKDGDIGAQDMEEILQKRIHASLPEDYRAVLSAMNQGRSLAEAAPKSPLSRAVDRLARNISGREARTASGAGKPLFGFLRRKQRDAHALSAGLEAS